MNKHGMIDWARYELIKWEINPKDESQLLKFDAPTMGGQWPEEYTKKSRVSLYTPHPDLRLAMDSLKPLVCRAMDWRQDSEKFDQIEITGLEYKKEEGLVSLVYISFQYKSEGTGMMGIYKKGAAFSMFSGTTASLDEDELGAISNLVQEIGLYFGRRKGANDQLFSNDWDEDQESNFTNVKLGNN